MKLKRKPSVVNAVRFRRGMETGIVTKVHEGREPWDRTTVEYPYIMYKYQKLFINFGDWLITEQDGTQYAMTDADVKKYFDEITDEVELKLSRLLDS
jgi:hypothetical protein